MKGAWFRIPRAPTALLPLLRPPRDAVVTEWMARNGVNEEEVMRSAWFAFLLFAIGGMIMSGLALLLMDAIGCLSVLAASAVSPLLASSWVSNRPARMAKRESICYLRHAPSVIGAMAMSMNVSPSLERAVLFASTTGRNPLGKRLAQASWGVLTRSWPDVESALSELAGSLGQANIALRQSLHLFIASTHEPTKAGMEQLMEKAHEITVQGLRDAADRYVAGLSTPVMVIFAMGILLPIMLLSIVPLLSISGPYAAEGVTVEPGASPLAPLAFLILVVIPLCCMAYCRSILSSSPLSAPASIELDPKAHNLWPWLLWLAALVAYLVLVTADANPYLTLVFIALPPSLILWTRHRRNMNARPIDEGDLVLGLYQIGNRLATGASLERAIVESAQTNNRGTFADWCSELLHRSRMSRIPLIEAMREIDPAPDRPLVGEAFQTVASCAESDVMAAGRVAVRLAKSLGQIKDCENGIKERMRGLVDMMRSTSSIFAPIVLGVTVGLFGITSAFSGQAAATEWIVLLSGIYVVELALVVTYLTTFMVENKGWGQFATSVATRIPVAVAAFILVSLLAHAGFAQW